MADRVWPMEQKTLRAVAEAIRQGFRVGVCDACGGPEVFSKVAPAARCLRCGVRRVFEAVKAHTVSFRRCARCHEANMAGVPITRSYCPACQVLSRRTHRAPGPAVRKSPQTDQ